jgi:2-polyprenyl-6-methoxyphenol hydroxylase-like FAD-dependent oxidoreductase
MQAVAIKDDASSPHVSVEFDNGSVATADVVFAANGSNSFARALVLGDADKARRKFEGLLVVNCTLTYDPDSFTQAAFDLGTLRCCFGQLYLPGGLVFMGTPVNGASGLTDADSHII